MSEEDYDTMNPEGTIEYDEEEAEEEGLEEDDL